MRKYLSALVIGLFLLNFSVAAQEGRVLVLVNSAIYPELRAEIDRYVGDISDEYVVSLFETSGGTAQDLRNFIISQKNDLIGCVLIGSMPVCMYEIENDLAAEHPTLFPCDLFFMDLDGTWSDNDNNGIYDSHLAGTGDVAPEIFIGRIDNSLLSPNKGGLVEDLRNYFNRNHNYWTGNYPLRKTGLVYTDDEWKDYSPINDCMASLYGIGNYQTIKDERVSSKDYLANRLSNEQYEFIQLAAHSDYSNHGFANMGQVYPDEIVNVPPKALGYNLFACSACDYSMPDFIGSKYIFNNSEKSLVVIGSTKIGSMLQFYAFYEPLGQNKSIGKSYNDWFEYIAPYDDSERSWHYGMTILGDPLIKFNSGGNNHGPLVDIGKNLQILWSDSIAKIVAIVTDDGLPENSTITCNWELLKGPGNATFKDENSLSTSVQLDTIGDYRIKLSAADGEFISEDFKEIKVGRIKWEGEANGIHGMGIIVRDTLAYISSGLFFNIVNIADPVNPHTISTYQFQGPIIAYPYFNNLDIDSSYAYIALSEKGLVIIDISDIYYPYEVGTFKPDESLEKFYAVKVIGDYAYIADNIKGLMILDIHSRTDPKLMGYSPTGGDAENLYIQDNYAYIADGTNGLRIIDISNKTQPKEVGYFKDVVDIDDGGRESIQVISNYAYISCRDSTYLCSISIIDISNKTKPLEVTRLYNTRIDDAYKGFYVEGNYLYYYSWAINDAIGIIDITDKSNPIFIESQITEGYSCNSKNIFKYQNCVYILISLIGRGMDIYKVSLKNTAPYVYAGKDTISCNNSLLLYGMISDDNLPAESSLSYSWDKISGPGNVSFFNPHAPGTQVSISDTGTYILRLTVSDGELTGFDDVQIDNLLAPISNNIEICEGKPVPYLIAKGQGVKWYDDLHLTNLIHCGDTLYTEQTTPGQYVYYVVQSIGNCVSQADTVVLTIKSLPVLPLSQDLKVCANQPVPDLYAFGENIRWYTDSLLTYLVQTGDNLVTSQTETGVYKYYVTQTIMDCESNPKDVKLIINDLPDISLGKDTLIYSDQNLILGPYPDTYCYLWNDGSQNPYYEISALHLGTGLHNISVIAIDSNSCTNSDSLVVNVIHITNVNGHMKSRLLEIYPNPTDEWLNILLLDFPKEDVLLKIFDQNGIEVYNEKVHVDEDLKLHVKISFLPPGLYFMDVVSGSKKYTKKIILR